MTASETTRLLSHKLRDDSDDAFDNDKMSRIRKLVSISLAFFVVAVAAVSLISRNMSRKTVTVQETYTLFQSTFLVDDAMLLQWDSWKDETNRAKVWFGELLNEVPNATKAVQNQIQSDKSQISTWWNGTTDSREAFVQSIAVNAQQFGDHVKTWWDDTASASQRTISNAEVNDKVQIIQNNFKRWWEQANETERSWWNATVRQLQLDEQLSGEWAKQNGGAAAERGSEWVNTIKSTLRGDEATVVEAGGKWLNATQSELEVDAAKGNNLKEKWTESAKSTLNSEGLAVMQRGKELVNGTQKALRQNVEKAFELEQGWANATEEALRSDKALAMKKRSEMLNATEEALADDAAVVGERTNEWLNSVSSDLKDDAAEIERKKASIWNGTQASLRYSTNATEEKFALWWATTKSFAHKATDAEEEWWNASEYWLRNHLKQKPLAERSSTIMRALLYLNNSYAYSLLMNGFHWYDYSSDFFLIQAGWDVQINQAYCAVASAAAVLNSFRPYASIPVDPIYNPYAYATQENLFNDCVQDTVVHRNVTYDGLLSAPGGLSLKQLQQFIQCNNLKASIMYVDPSNVTVNHVRQDLEEALMNPAQRVIVNFNRKGIGQDGGGHFSPLGSYAKKEDAFLLMDVAKYKYPPVWIPTERLYNALASEDECGDWLYPTTQDRLRVNRYPTSSKQYESIMRTLKCRKMYRGYVVVQLPN
jgi:Phytochelatin synthase